MPTACVVTVMKKAALTKTLPSARACATTILALLAFVPNITAVFPTAIVSESGPQIIDGYKFQGGGLMWWKTGISASEEFEGVEGLVGIRRAQEGIAFNLSSSRTFDLNG